MTGKNQKVRCYGYMEVVPAPSFAVVGSSCKKRGRTDAFETQNTTKTLYKDAGGGCSAKLSKSEKAGAFVDKRSGNQGFKQEVNYQSSVKVNDKVQGCTTEYETQVKFKKTTTYNTPKKPAAASKSSSGYKNIKYYDY